MPSKISVDQIAHSNETNALEIDTSGNVTIQQDLKFAGNAAIKDSAGNNVISESAGVITVNADAAVISGSSTGDLVRITQTGTGNALVVEDSTNPDSTPFVVNAGGLVGIGTSSPQSNLEISAATNTSVQLTTTADSTPVLDFRTNGTDRLRISSSSATGATFNVRSNQEMQFYTNNTERMRIDSSGNVGIGALPVSGYKLFTIATSGNVGQLVKVQAIAPTVMQFWNSQQAGGAISIVAGGGTTYGTGSDYRLKENITKITDGITRVKQLKPSKFNFIVAPDIIYDGFIAHEVQSVVPDAIVGEKDAVNEDGSIKPQMIDQSKLVPLLTAALQESITLIESLQTTVADLTARIEALEPN